MEFLRKLLAQTQSHMRGLTLSQRLAIGSCVGLIAVSLLWLVDWAAKPALVPLLDQQMSSQELAPIQQQLDAQHVEYKVSGTTLLVPAESRTRLLAVLGEQHALPNDISIGFAKMMEENSPWLSMAEQDRRWSVARAYELSRVLQKFNGVLEARVLIDEKSRRTIGQPPVMPTASIFVKMAPGTALDKERVVAMASFVSRAVAGLEISNVAVTDATTGRSYTVPSPAEGMAFDDLEDRQKKEEYFAAKIKSLLANIPALLVAVHAELDAESRKETTLKNGRPVQLTERTETTTQERGSASGGPGVVPNAGRAVATGTPVERTEKKVEESTFDGKADVTQTTTEAPRHGLKSLSASVNVPRSYLASIYKQANNGKDPTDADLDTSGEKELEKIRQQVKGALGVPEGSKSVVVDWFHDEAVVKLSDAVEAGPSDGMLALARAYGGKVGIGALAVVSLFMMLMMMRRAGDGPVLPGEEPPARVLRMKDRRRGEAASMTIAYPPVGEAEVTEQLLIAKEVDEQTVRTQQVVEQVVELIRDDPKTSVGILKSWIDAEKG